MESKSRPVHRLSCKYCEDAFPAQRTDAQYCSSKCRQGAYLIRGAEKYVRRQLVRLENRYEYLKQRGRNVTKREIQDVLQEIKMETKGWWFRRLPDGNQLRDYVEDKLVMKVDGLHIHLL